MSLWETPSKNPLGLLSLLELKGVGPRTAEALSEAFPTLGQIHQASPTKLAEFTTPQARASLIDEAGWQAAYDRALGILEQAHRLSIKVITPSDAEFPTLLKAIPDSPLILYMKGTLRPGTRYVACIGTREPSQFGIEAARGIVKTLCQHNWGIVSGLALGIDSISHQAALDNNGHTVAILGNSLEEIYPKSNVELADKILASGGAILSEQPFGTPAIPRTLVKRDRLQSGMSVGTVVMQTDITGGSMHTVRFTLTQKRLLIVPVPQGKHAEETKSRGIVALAEKTGMELCSIIKAEGEYANLLREFGNRKVSIPLASREQYSEMLTRLEGALSGNSQGQNSQLPLF